MQEKSTSTNAIVQRRNLVMASATIILNVTSLNAFGTDMTVTIFYRNPPIISINALVIIKGTGWRSPLESKVWTVHLFSRWPSNFEPWDRQKMILINRCKVWTTLNWCLTENFMDMEKVLILEHGTLICQWCMINESWLIFGKIFHSKLSWPGKTQSIEPKWPLMTY